MPLSQRAIDVRFMKRALLLARKGTVAPNPMVGCVAVKGGRIVGEGYHQRFGGPHAEVVALSRAGDRAAGSTLYVTLEPCDHFGKTPPCTNSILAAGVARVVVAMLDPNPRVRGRGISRLRRNSVRVSTGVMRSEARSLNAPYVRSWNEGSGCVVAKAAMSLDGKIATVSGDSKWITSRASRIMGYRARSSVDAVLVGRGTVQQDDPELTSHGSGRNPVRVVIDPSFRTSIGSRVFNRAAPTILIHSLAGRRGKLEDVRRKGVLTVYLPARRGRIDFRATVRKLRALGIRRLLIEGGGETLAAAFAAGVVTEVMFFVAPKVLGGKGAKTPVEGPGVPALADATRLSGLKAQSIGQDILLTAQVSVKKRRG